VSLSNTYTPVANEPISNRDQAVIEPPIKKHAQVRQYALLGGAACLLLGFVEWVDLNIQLTPIFESFRERITFTSYFSLNLLSGLGLGLLTGLSFHAGSFLKGHIERLLARGKTAQLHHRWLAGLSVCALFAIVFNQQWHIYRFAISLIREGEKIEALNQPLLNHERSSSYLIVFGLVIFFSCLRWLTRAFAKFHWLLKMAFVTLLVLIIASAYYVDSRLEVQLYEHSMHNLMFVIDMSLTMTLLAAIYSSAPRLQLFWPRLSRSTKLTLIIAFSVLWVGAVVFTFAHFDKNHNLKTQVFYRSTQARQHFLLLQGVLDFDRDGFSALLGGGDANDRRADINPGQTEIVADGLDNNCIGGDLSAPEIANWEAERRSRHAAASPSARPLNVIYIFIDALRPDHLGAYGYTKKTSPNLDKLAGRGTVFENAYTPAPNTFEALPKFMKSSYWDAHVPSWTEVLANKGYNCLLFPRRITTLLRHVKGMTVAPRSPDGTFEGTINVALELLGKAPPERPFCAYLYATDPHLPYKQHPGFDFGTTDIDHYDSEIAYVDFHLGRLFDWMEKSGRLNDTMVAIMSDHGESLGERGLYRHSTQLYNEQARIPMIIYVPNLAPRYAADYVSSIDLGATILNAAGLEYPAEYAGVSLLPVMRGEPFTHPPVFAEQTTEEDSPFLRPEQNLVPHTKKYMVITQDGYKLIFNRDFYCFELFNLRNDPREERNLYDHLPEKSAEMKSLLGRYIDIVITSRPADADETQYHYGPTRGREEGTVSPGPEK
jgi:arylsulfatase A-like enzyme